MKMLTLSLLICAISAQSRALSLTPHPEEAPTLPALVPTAPEEAPPTLPAHDHTIPEETTTPPHFIMDYGLTWHDPDYHNDVHGPGGGFVDHLGPSFCPKDWTYTDTHCLLYVSTPMGWEEAESYCKTFSKGTWESLASLMDSHRADEIHELMKKAGNEHGQVWVGGYNTEDKPAWTWTDIDHPSQLHQWCSDGKHEHHCLMANYEGNSAGCLADKDCKAQLPFVCSIVIM